MSNAVFFESKRKTALALFIIANISGAVSTLVYLTTSLAEGGRPDILHVVAWEFTGAYSAMLLFPAVLFIVFRYPATRKNYYKLLPLYILVAMFLGALHTGIMYASRSIIHDLAGWGKYCFGDLSYRYIMETLKVSAGYVGLCILIFFYRSYKEKQEQKLRAAKLEEQLARTRLALLKNQIQPHFLFNTLNMISSVMFDDVHTADRMIVNLSDMLRATIHPEAGGIHKLSDEMRILDSYLEIMRERYKDKLDIAYQIREECLDFPVPFFILQPLVENAIKHGMEILTYLNIIIGAEKTGDMLKLFIRDNGPGISSKPEDLYKEGIGLSNTRECLENIYGGRSQFYWENLEGEGFVVTLILPEEI